MADDTAALTASWDSIVDILTRNGIDMTPTSSDDGVLREWYDESSAADPAVRFWFARQCWRCTTLFPSTATLDPARSVDISRLWVQVEQGSDYEPESSDADQEDLAGGWAGTYDKRFVPIADQDGVTVIVDTRPGPRQGCVSEYKGAFIDETDVRWSSLAELFTELRTALTGNELFADRYTAAFRDGHLTWSVAG
ncbi:hypothetical protein HQ325_17020 [Rhodococcus sp. BP-349]|uniref:hypothetical protein n=1 Tax=unclassified Rhodococcus (in: high G+C Gram-positive bacteria) TaxID=192944 RepID=UPI001C9A809C|nr:MULTISPECIES: hypothetical protein [unclassified Rhodococcus (in: high G+C Gram-positive bacteria)]MBY6540379.1 hypothetical protein [Rhodococcus sp. BP-363]MBY6545596.1 hypothetical protein [Rhodococcus sp. BP-369]MBY6564826.1 hypothetical protein [Rhodococcus sp. BP-370]MBY6578238.1 hypothetical protein [Rhodococcus sp. BP-364]MBY6587539.1 hypothetical protein [Rhodococcus sp. BP-358]